MCSIKEKKKRLGNNTQLKASSVLEVVTSLIIITIIFGLFASIYVKIVQSGYTLSHAKANSLLTLESLDTKKNKSFFNETKVIDNITIIKRVEIYQGIDRLFKIDLEAQNNDKKLLARRKELFLDEE